MLHTCNSAMKILLWTGQELTGLHHSQAYLCLTPLSLEPSYPGVPALIYGFRISSTNPCSFLLVFYRQSSHRKPLISFILSESLLHGIETLSKIWFPTSLSFYYLCLLPRSFLRIRIFQCLCPLAVFCV